MVNEYKMQDIKTWNDSSEGDQGGMKIRRHVEVAVVRDDEEYVTAESHGKNAASHQGHSAFVSGPRNTSFHGHQV